MKRIIHDRLPRPFAAVRWLESRKLKATFSLPLVTTSGLTIADCRRYSLAQRYRYVIVRDRSLMMRNCCQRNRDEPMRSAYVGATRPVSIRSSLRLSPRTCEILAPAMKPNANRPAVQKNLAVVGAGPAGAINAAARGHQS